MIPALSARYRWIRGFDAAICGLVLEARRFRRKAPAGTRPRWTTGAYIAARCRQRHHVVPAVAGLHPLVVGEAQLVLLDVPRCEQVGRRPKLGRAILRDRLLVHVGPA